MQGGGQAGGPPPVSPLYVVWLGNLPTVVPGPAGELLHFDFESVSAGCRPTKTAVRAAQRQLPLPAGWEGGAPGTVARPPRHRRSPGIGTCAAPAPRSLPAPPPHASQFYLLPARANFGCTGGFLAELDVGLPPGADSPLTMGWLNFRSEAEALACASWVASVPLVVGQRTYTPDVRVSAAGCLPQLPPAAAVFHTPLARAPSCMSLLLPAAPCSTPPARGSLHNCCRCRPPLLLRPWD